MIRYIVAGALLGVLAVIALVASSVVAPAVAAGLHPRCNIDWPCVAPVKNAFFNKGEGSRKNQNSREARRIARGQRLEQAMPFGSPMYPPETARSFLSGDLVSKARQYMGGNPTGWRSLWCGRFMAMIAPAAAARIRNPNMARDWARLPHVSPRVGAIAVLSRGRRGGHVGVVTGFDGRGNPIIVSGNHGKRVGEGVYPAKRVLAYVDAS